MNDYLPFKLKFANAWEWIGFEKQEQAKLFFNFYSEQKVAVSSTGM